MKDNFVKKNFWKIILGISCVIGILLWSFLLFFYLSKRFLGFETEFYYFLYRFMMGFIFLVVYPFLPYLVFMQPLSETSLKATKREKKILFFVSISLGIILFWIFFDIKNILWLLSFFNYRRGFYYFGFLTMFIFIFSFIGIHTLYNRLNYQSWDIPRGLSTEEKKQYNRATRLIYSIFFSSWVILLVAIGSIFYILEYSPLC